MKLSIILPNATKKYILESLSNAYRVEDLGAKKENKELKLALAQWTRSENAFPHDRNFLRDWWLVANFQIKFDIELKRLIETDKFSVDQYETY